MADDLGDYERKAGQLVDDAEQLQWTLAANPPASPEVPVDGGPATLTAEGEAQNNRRRHASEQLAQLQREFDVQVQGARERASRAGADIRSAVQDGVKDNWWERHSRWLRKAKTVLGILAAVAGIALAIVAAIATAPLWLVVLAVGLALFTLAISLGLAVKADGSWVDVGFDAVALLSLGTGSFASWLAARTFPAVRSAVAGIRAQRAQRAIDTANSPLRWLRRIASNSHAPSGEQAAARALLAEVTTKARAAATAARSATSAPFPVTRVQRLIDGGLGPSRIARQAREMLLDLRTMPGPPIDPVVLRSARNLVLQSTVGIVATNVGAVFQMADLIRDIRGGLSDGGVFQVATDVVVRLR